MTQERSRRRTATTKHRPTSGRSREQQAMIRRQIIIGVCLLVGLGVLLIAIWYGSRVERLQIQTIDVVGGITISHDQVREAVEAELEGTYYRLIPKRFSPLFPQEMIQTKVEETPRIKEVRLSKDGPQRLIVAFTEYRPHALWCTVSSEECLFLDHTGYAFAPAPTLTGSAFVRYYLPDTELTAKANPFDDDVFRTTRAFIDRLQQELNLYVIKVTLEPAGDLTYQLAGGAEIKVSPRLTSEESITNLRTLFQNESFADLATGDFDYIDLRFGDKVFVSEEAFVGTSTATSSTPEVDE